MFGRKNRHKTFVSYSHPSDIHSFVTEGGNAVSLGNIDFLNTTNILAVDADTFTPTNIMKNPSLMVSSSAFGIHPFDSLEERVNQMAAAPQDEIDEFLSTQTII